jgi:hypothetical protein
MMVSPLWEIDLGFPACGFAAFTSKEIETRKTAIRKGTD